MIVGEPPVAWTGPLSIDLVMTGELLERKYAALAAQTSQTEALRAVVGEDRYRQILQTERFAAFVTTQRTMQHACRVRPEELALLLMSNGPSCT